MNAVRGIGIGIGIGVTGSFLAFGAAMVFLFANASTLGTSDGTFWALVGSFGLGPTAAVAAAANILYFLMAGLFAGLGVVSAWPYTTPEPPDRISLGPPVVAGIVGALVGAFALPILTVAMAPDVAAWLGSRTFPGDWVVVAGMLVLAGLGGIVAATVGRAISEMIVRSTRPSDQRPAEHPIAPRT